MEGNRRIVFFQPGALVDNTSLNRQRRPPITHVVYAVRKDSAGAGEGTVSGNIIGGNWTREYTIRAESLPLPPSEEWSIEDEGVYLDIVGIAEKTSGPWARYLTITCVRRSPGEC